MINCLEIRLIEEISIEEIKGKLEIIYSIRKEYIIEFVIILYFYFWLIKKLSKDLYLSSLLFKGYIFFESGRNFLKKITKMARSPSFHPSINRLIFRYLSIKNEILHRSLISHNFPLKSGLKRF